MRRKLFSILISASMLLTVSSLLKVFTTSSLMVDNNPVHDGTLMLVIAAMFFLAVILGSYAYGKIVFRKPGFDLTRQETKRLAQIVVVITSFMAPMLSNDFSIYLAHGNLLAKGILSYTDGTKLQASDFFQYVSFHWRDCPNFYGPPLLLLLYVAALIGGKSIGLSLIVFKLINTAFLFLYIRFAAKYLEKKPDGKFNQLALATLAPILWIQAAGQAHGDGIIIMLVMLSLHLFQQRKYLVASAMIGIIIACKVMYAAVFIPFLLAVIIFNFRSELKKSISVLIKSLACAAMVVALSYSLVWEGVATITVPIDYHNHKPPANSFASLLTEVAIASGLHEHASKAEDINPDQRFFSKRRYQQNSGSQAERAEALRRNYHAVLIPAFKIFGLALALFNFLSLAGAKKSEDVLHIFGKILIITVCFFSPIFHPWYLLLPLPFVIDTEKRSWIIWLMLVPALACLHEIKFVIPMESPFYFCAEALILPALASLFLYFRRHFLTEPLKMTRYGGR